MTQTWHDLLFAHWRVPASELAPLVPPELPLDTFDGHAWIGVIPFHMTNVAPRGVPSLPYVSAFPELNVRTYVTRDAKPGVYFFSLDAGSAVAVAAARALFGLPYYTATMDVRDAGGAIEYTSRREGGLAAEFAASYTPSGSARPPQQGSLEYFLTERYCLYTVDDARCVHRVEIHHPPWPLQPANADIRVNTMAAAAGIRLPETAPLLHFSRRQDMVGWMREQVG